MSWLKERRCCCCSKPARVYALHHHRGVLLHVGMVLLHVLGKVVIWNGKMMLRRIWMWMYRKLLYCSVIEHRCCCRWRRCSCVVVVVVVVVRHLRRRLRYWQM